MDIKKYDIGELSIAFVIDGQDIRLAFLGETVHYIPPKQGDDYRWHKPLEVHISGENQNDHHFNKMTGSSEGFALKLKSVHEETQELFKTVCVTQESEKLLSQTYYCFYLPEKVVRCYSKIQSKCDGVKIEYISSFSYVGFFNSKQSDWFNQTKFYLPHNYWQGECVWKKYTCEQAGLYPVQNFSGKRVALSSTGGWSSHEYLPMGMVENTQSKQFMLWQIEHNGSWNYEVSTISGGLYIIATGPNAAQNAFVKTLDKGETFASEKVGVAFGSSINDVFGQITMYRRKIRRINQDNKFLPIIFNDYMNCLYGDPTTEKELPLIDKAAEIGCEYYCIDCGWYDDGDWWSTVGEWKPAVNRFSSGLKNLIDYIKSKGMTAGLWLEIEVMGMDNKLANSLPDDWFFMRNGRRVIDHSRYHLDFSNKNVRDYASGVIQRLISDYGIGYIKMDYNINSGVGTESNGTNAGEGLYRHNKSYLAWLEEVFNMYPNLVIENCASGGLRMDYASLSLCSIQSTSDQVDYKKYAAISANCATAVTPEQAAVWSYPVFDCSLEETVFNMVNCMLFRIHQSGHLANLPDDRLILIKQAIEIYKNIRENISRALPLFLSDLNYYDAPYLAYGLDLGEKVYVAVWNLDNLEDNIVNFPFKISSAKVLYPKSIKTDFAFGDENLNFAPSQKYQARLFEINKE